MVKFQCCGLVIDAVAHSDFESNTQPSNPQGLGDQRKHIRRHATLLRYLDRLWLNAGVSQRGPGFGRSYNHLDMSLYLQIRFVALIVVTYARAYIAAVVAVLRDVGMGSEWMVP